MIDFLLASCRRLHLGFSFFFVCLCLDIQNRTSLVESAISTDNVFSVRSTAISTQDYTANSQFVMTSSIARVTTGMSHMIYHSPTSIPISGKMTIAIWFNYFIAKILVIKVLRCSRLGPFSLIF
jgi:hypothetical protein